METAQNYSILGYLNIKILLKSGGGFPCHLVLSAPLWQFLKMILFKSIRLLSVFLFIFVMGGMSTTIYAQDAVQIRGSDHDGYSRLVMEWPQSVSFEVSQNNDQIEIKFDKAATADVTAINQKTLRNIGGVASVTSDPLTLAINVVPNAKYRDFKIGKRVMLDVYDSEGTPEPAAQTSQVSTPPNTPAELETNNDTPAPSNENLQQVNEAGASPEQTAPSKISGNQPHLITVSGTQAIGMAAFERAGFLWLIFDQASLRTPPVLSGPNAESFPPLEKIEVGIDNGGTAYRMPKPEGYYFYGEGGGILWRLVMTPTPRDTKASAPVITPSSNLLWPMASAAKIIKFEDPIVGDEVSVATVTSAEDFSGMSREYVEFETFTSPIGLAFAPRADDITITKNTDGVEISKPNGLAVSPTKDIAATSLKDDLTREEEIFVAEDSPSQINPIYDFNRWQMGGLNALDQNRKVLMSSLNNKNGAAKAEDLITLAKLNIANDRGPEALGLLRVAAVELPGIEESPEFVSLRAAASALSGHYEDALKDYQMPALINFNETNYWKAYSLAGLEDWVQAEQVMPPDLRVLKTYPNPIREPITLSLAETSLRAGRLNTAQDLLESLEPDYPKMSFSRQSAWQYLNGELERQKGNFDRAMDNWSPLLTGDDDYYRAKAGLSVTRMQLEREKITPEKAIDRLEGLRYAWRGDELESLINYRLGELYIANNDYLKGLSVLRNAVSISPNAKVTEEITNYMTSTFRKIFTDGELDNVSPIDAVSIYEEFKELTPIGAEGDLFIQNLAERLVEMDLLERATGLLDHQVTHRLKGDERAKVAIRLGAIRLLNNQYDGALAALDTASTTLNAGGQADPFKMREINLLRARALSKLNRSNAALSILQNMKEDKDVIRLRADIAWAAGQWDVAASAFEKLILSENVSQSAPPSEYASKLILNRAIALNLAGERSALDNIAREYGDVMRQSDSAQIFELVTRPRNLGLLDNRETITSLISEVDLFGGFLENYKSTK